MTGRHRLFTPSRSLALIIFCFCLVAFVGQYVKFISFGYNGLDLAIYSQVVHESSQGRLFEFTIHPHSYLGDHVEFFLLALVPFYWIYASPLTLLALQTLALGLAAVPLYRFSKRRLGGWWGVGIAAAYLLSPFIWNANFFEFHVLPFAIPLLLAIIDAYDRRAIKEFWVLSLLALTVREDVAFVLIGIGILAIIQRRKSIWSIPVLLASAAWFFTALNIAKSFGTLGQYKFLSYYGWLGPDLPSIIKNFFIHPLVVIKTFFGLSLLIFSVGLILPFALLPIFSAAWLIPAIPIVIQLGLGRLAGALALETHYTSLIIPFMFAASASGLHWLLSRPHRSKVLNFFAGSRGTTAVILAAITIYSFVVIGPVRGIVDLVRPDSVDLETRRLKSDILSYVPKTAPLATGYSLISRAAERPVLASLHYVYLGSEQFSERPYQLPDSINTVLIDESDFLFYQVAYQGNKKNRTNGADNYRKILADQQLGLKLAFDDLRLYDKAAAADPFIETQTLSDLPDRSMDEPREFSNGLTLHGWTDSAETSKTLTLGRATINRHKYYFLPLTLYWSADQPQIRNSSFILKLTADGAEYTKEYPLAPLLPPTEWKVGEYIATSHRFFIPSGFAQTSTVASIDIMESTGVLSLDGARSIAPQYKTRTSLGVQELGRFAGTSVSEPDTR